MRRARIFLAITAYMLLIQRKVTHSFFALFGSKPNSSRESMFTHPRRKGNSPLPSNINNRFYFPSKDICNLGLTNGYTDRFLLI
ncbi:MAG TPA: hypothetical protein VMW01_03650 [Williamwhitmania sp.]|nr:hypothetical protein [Williamwhitmania sp.]